VTRDSAFDCDEVFEDPLYVMDVCSSLITISGSNELVPGDTVSTFDREEVLEDPLEPMDIPSSRGSISGSDEMEFDINITLAHYSVQECLVSGRIKQSKAKQYNI
jgi:hypothetical protein